VIHSSVSLIRGSIPPGIIRFNLSSNHIKGIDSGVFSQSLSRRVSSSVLVARESSSSHTQSIKDSHRHFGTNDTSVLSGSSDDDEGSSIRSSHSTLSESGNKEQDETLSKNTKDTHKETQQEQEQTDDTDEDVVSTLREIDLSHNKISEIPPSILHLKGLRSLRIAGED